MNVFADISWGFFLACLAGLLVIFNVAVFMFFKISSRRGYEKDEPDSISTAVDVTEEDDEEPVPENYSLSYEEEFPTYAVNEDPTNEAEEPEPTSTDYDEMEEEKKREVFTLLQQQTDRMIPCSSDDEDMYFDPNIKVAAAYCDEEELSEEERKFVKFQSEVANAHKEIDVNFFKKVEDNYELDI